MDGVAPIRMLAVDLDGTLLDDNKQIGQATLQALRGLAHVKVIIASARPPRSVRHFYTALRLDTLQINYNGALIWDEVNRKVVFHRPLAAALARQIIQTARDMFEEVLVTCEILDVWHTDRFDQKHTTETGRLFSPDVIAPIQTFWDRDITKLLLLADPPIILRLEETIARKFSQSISMVRTDENLIQIMDKRVSKAVALQLVGDYYAIPMQQVMSIGDAPNDVGMLQVSGVAVAMDNAHRLVKQVAHWVAPSNNDHGVRAALQRYGLCQ